MQRDEIEQRRRWAARALADEAPRGILPADLRNNVVQRSRKGPLGQVKVKRFTGLVPNSTTRILKKFEQQAGGLSQVGLALAASGATSDSISKVIDMIADPAQGRKGLARIVAAAKADPAVVISMYTKGVLALGHAHTIAEIAKDLPRVGRQLVREALPQKVVCRSCFGAKVIVQRGKEYPCRMCDGQGSKEELGPHFEFASRQLFELAGMTQKQGGVNVAVNTQTNVQVGGASLLERLTAVSDSIIHNTKDVVEAEVLASGGQASGTPDP